MFVHKKGHLGFKYTKYQMKKKQHLKVFPKKDDIEENMCKTIGLHCEKFECRHRHEQ